MVVFFFFCEEYSFGLFFRGVKIIGRSNPSSSRASSSSSSRQSRRCGGGASSSFDPTTFNRASASAQTSSSSPLRWSFFFSLYSKSDGDGDGVSPSIIQKSPRRCRRTKTPHRALRVLLCRLFFFSLSSETLCLSMYALSRALSIFYNAAK